jgi:hypothetical protein
MNNNKFLIHITLNMFTKAPNPQTLNMFTKPPNPQTQMVTLSYICSEIANYAVSGEVQIARGSKMLQTYIYDLLNISTVL